MISAYIVGTPKSQLKKFQAHPLKDKDWTEVQDGVEVKFVGHHRVPINPAECRSRAGPFTGCPAGF